MEPEEMPAKELIRLIGKFVKMKGGIEEIKKLGEEYKENKLSANLFAKHLEDHIPLIVEMIKYYADVSDFTKQIEYLAEQVSRVDNTKVLSLLGDMEPRLSELEEILSKNPHIKPELKVDFSDITQRLSKIEETLSELKNKNTADIPGGQPDYAPLTNMDKRLVGLEDSLDYVKESLSKLNEKLDGVDMGRKAKEKETDSFSDLAKRYETGEIPLETYVEALGKEIVVIQAQLAKEGKTEKAAEKTVEDAVEQESYKSEEKTGAKDDSKQDEFMQTFGEKNYMPALAVLASVKQYRCAVKSSNLNVPKVDSAKMSTYLQKLVGVGALESAGQTRGKTFTITGLGDSYYNSHLDEIAKAVGIETDVISEYARDPALIVSALKSVYTHTSMSPGMTKSPLSEIKEPKSMSRQNFLQKIYKLEKLGLIEFEGARSTATIGMSVKGFVYLEKHVYNNNKK